MEKLNIVCAANQTKLTAKDALDVLCSLFNNQTIDMNTAIKIVCSVLTSESNGQKEKSSTVG